MTIKLSRESQSNMDHLTMNSNEVDALSAEKYKLQNPIPPIHRHWEGFKSFPGFLNELKLMASRLYYFFGKIFHHTFLFDHQRFGYFYHRYNVTWRSERTVEVPLIWKMVKENKEKRILEVGNVLSHYFKTSHDVLDKYEIAPNITNQDIIDFMPRERYDLIVSISTFEHIGYDEEIRDPQKISRAVHHLISNCLKPGGVLVATFPFGYNSSLDQMIEMENLPFTKHSFLKRITSLNHWREVPFSEIKQSKYDHPFPFANGLVVSESEKNSQSNLK